MDQRALFFIVAAVVAALLAPVTDDELRYVPELVAVVYAVLAAASYLDWRTNKR
ncbi:MAG TPA: hypothetical protein VG795_14400 [Acidimicrobiia bacterium]|nr:hypothetical protein [Acidimicrobiia bacterium]